jgi:hypothetical protein
MQAVLLSIRDMPAKLHVPTGQRFGRLEVIREADRHGGRRHFLCRCDCGTEVVVSLSNLRTGNSTSCGCLFREERERSNQERAAAGYKHHPLRSIHNGIVRRCLDPDNKDYPRYGGAGVQLYEPWRNRGRFIEDVLREIGPRPSLRHSVDRIDPRGHYEPGNIRWATPLDQKANQRQRCRILSDAEVRAIRARYAQGGITQQAVAEAFGVRQSDVSRVIRGVGRFGRGMN